MGDNLAEQLYLVFCANKGLVPGSGDTPNWASMPIAEREVWEAVATKARNVMSDRFLASIDEQRKRCRDVVEAIRDQWAR